MIKCPNPDCGYENVDGTQFCEGCGEELPQAGASATGANAASGNAGGNTPIHGAASPATSAASGMVRCPACENMNPADNVVCEVCGTELHPGVASGVTSGATSTTSPLVSGATSSTGAAPATSINMVPTADPLASGTAAPPLSMATSGLSAGSTAVSVTSGATTSDAAPSALSPGLGSAMDTSAFPAPVVMLGAATSGVSPTGTTMPTSNDALTSPSSTSAPIAGGIASSDPVSISPTSAADTSTVDPAATSSTMTALSGNLQPGHVKMTVEQGMTIGKQFVLGDNEVLVGREDEEEQIFPDIDLSDQDEGYVHRKHAQLKFENGGLTVTHLGGANKTRVNNKPLADNVPQAVNIGDKVSFGKVVMRVGSV